MRADNIVRFVGAVLLLDALFMFLAAIVSLFNDVDTAFYPLLLSGIITLLVGSFPLIFVPAGLPISSKEGYLIVIASWIMSCVVGMLPYIIWGGEFSLANAFFESTSGYTTTGATVLNNVEALPSGLQFWRASTLWIGGVGVVLFALVILPSMGRSKMTLSSVELSSLAKDNFRYNTRKILKIILFVYVGLSAILTLALRVAGMEWLDSVCHSFSTLATGGFSTKNLSIMYYDSVWIEGILAIFMIIAGIHFGVIYATIKGKANNIFKNEVVRFYFISLMIACIAVTANLYLSGIYDTLSDTIRYGFFQVISYNTTSGFASISDGNWPPFSVLIMLYMSIQCATAGSTTGGVKADRILLLFKSIKARVLKLQHPNAVIRIRLNNNPVEDSTVSAAVQLIAFYIFAIFISTLFITLWNFDLLTSFSATIAAISNVGPGFGQVSNLSNMNGFPDILKLWLSGIMLFGRLELFGLIHLFLIKSWK